MLGIGEIFPTFSLPASMAGGAISTFSSGDNSGWWTLYLFWPKDFTDQSLSELLEFGELEDEFRRLDARVLGCSVESAQAHAAWRREETELGKLAMPLLSDSRRDLCSQLGILDESTGAAQCATFIVDPQEIIRFVYVTSDGVSRDPGEVLRVLSDLRNPELL